MGETDKGETLGRTTIGMGMGPAAAWPTRKRVKKKAMTAEREKNIVAGEQTNKRVGRWLVASGGAKRRSK